MYKTIIGIDGMMCPKCENHVNEMFGKTFDVEKVSSSHTEKQTVVTSKKPIDEAKVREMIKDMGYEFLSFSQEEYEQKKIKLFRK